MVDIELPWGGKMTWTSQGPLLVRDAPGRPDATRQQVTVLCMTSPRPKDIDGKGIGRPDNFFYPDRGGGLAPLVGTNAVAKNINAARARILSALSVKPNIAPTPTPTVTTDSSGPELVTAVSCFTKTGDVINVSSGG
jgi:hypothetical protein